MRFLVTTLITLVLLGAALGQEDNRRVLVNTVSVGADGKFETAPDTAVINFTIGAQDSSSEGAYKKARESADRMRQVLRNNGIDPKVAEVGFYSLEPMYDYRSPKRKVVGYRVSSSVTLKIKDFSKIGGVLTGLSTLEDSANQASLSYILETIDAAKQKAIEDALNKAKASAATVARVGGRTLGDLAYAAVDTFEQQPPVPMVAMKSMAMRAEAAPEAPTEQFTPQKVTVTAHVNALFNLK